MQPKIETFFVIFYNFPILLQQNDSTPHSKIQVSLVSNVFIFSFEDGIYVGVNNL